MTEHQRTVAMLFDSGRNRDRCVPYGGHQLNPSIASALHLNGFESYPESSRPSGFSPTGARLMTGYVPIPDVPGMGLELKASLDPVLRDLSD